MIEFEEVFRIVSEGEASHQSWIDAPDEWYEQTNTNTNIGGCRCHHTKWVNNYRKIREVLESCRQYIHEHR